MRIADRSFTVRQIYWQIPQPTQILSSILILKIEKSIEIAPVGHLDTHALQPFPAVHILGKTFATPMFTCDRSANGKSASVSQALTHGRSSHNWQGDSSGK